MTTISDNAQTWNEKLSKGAKHREAFFAISPRSHAAPTDILRAGRIEFLFHCVAVNPAVCSSLFPTDAEIEGFEPLGDISREGRVLMSPQNMAAPPLLHGNDTSYEDQVRQRLDAIGRWAAYERGKTEMDFRADWQARFQLPDDWCWDAALRTMVTHWPIRPKPGTEWDYLDMRFPRRGYRYGVDALEVNPIVGTVQPQKHTVMEWFPSYEPREKAKERMVAAIDAEFDRIEAENNLVKTPTKQPEHLQWLAMHVVSGKSPGDIALALNPGLQGEAKVSKPRRSAVRRVEQAIHRTANLIGLTLPSQ